jgi:protein-S-isoprenylcysteine O-methyltransferase Ste14
MSSGTTYMRNEENTAKIGYFLFKWRSFIPFLTIPLFLLALRTFTYPMGSYLLDRLWEIFCLLISFFGLAIRVITAGYAPKGTSGRTTNEPRASLLNTTGIYSIVRHPLYLGNFFIFLGISLFVRSLFFSIAVMLLFLLYYKRIIFAEEKFLSERFADTFEDWAKRTPVFFTTFKNWRKPELSFSLKTAFKREYTGLFTIVASFTCLEVLSDLFYTGKLQIDLFWSVSFICGLVIYITAWTLKKTHLLDVKGR